MNLNSIFQKKNLIKIFESALKKNCVFAKRMNQGFYGYVYLIETADGKKVIAKVYKRCGYIKNETEQLNMIRKYALVKVPEIYAVSYQKENGYFDVLFMEYIEGVNAAAIKITDKKEKLAFSNQVVENLLAINEVTTSDGFGSYITKEYCKSWEEYYKSYITNLCHAVHSRKPLLFSKSNVKLMDKLYESYDKIFSVPVAQSCLIHGDYNLWNLIADPKTNNLLAVIDPFESIFADRELELYQLQNANGDEYGLLENYASHIVLSDNFEVKNPYYFFWNDMTHMVKTGYCENKRFQKFGEEVLRNL